MDESILVNDAEISIPELFRNLVRRLDIYRFSDDCVSYVELDRSDTALCVSYARFNDNASRKWSFVPYRTDDEIKTDMRFYGHSVVCDCPVTRVVYRTPDEVVEHRKSVRQADVLRILSATCFCGGKDE